MSTINVTIYLDGVLTNPTTVGLEDSSGTFGVKRLDTGATVVAPTSMTLSSTGKYTHTFADPESNLEYEYVVEVVSGTEVYYRSFTAPAGSMNHTVVLPKSSPTYYTSQAEVYRRIGPIAGELHEDDLDPSERATLWSEILSEVTENIDFYTIQHYKRTTLLNNPWVRRKASILGAAILSMRRGQASLFSEQLQRTYDELTQIKEDRNAYIPNANPRGSNAPSVRNYVVQPHRGYHPLRVRNTVSTGDPYPGEDIAYEPFWF